MGEAANKMSRDDAQKRVVQLREEIQRKRELISVELEELRRRRSETIHYARQTAAIALGAGAGLFIVASLVNATLDLFRKESPQLPEDEDAIRSTKTVARKEARTSALLSAVTTLIVNELRKQAVEYARRELTSRLAQGRSRPLNLYGAHQEDGRSGVA